MLAVGKNVVIVQVSHDVADNYVLKHLIADAGIQAYSYCIVLRMSYFSNIDCLRWGFLGAAIFDCIIRSCDLSDWFIQTCFGPTVIPAIIMSLELL